LSRGGRIAGILLPAVLAALLGPGLGATAGGTGGGDPPAALAVACEVLILVDPIDLASIASIGPGRTKALPMAVMNSAGPSMNYTLSISTRADPNATFWDAELNVTEIRAVPPGGSAEARVLVSAAPDAPERASLVANVTVEAEGGDCRAHREIAMYVLITRGLRLSGEPVKTGDNGETLSFALRLTNRGDVREEGITVMHVIGVGEHWPVDVSMAMASLDPGESANFTVRISIPSDAPGSVPGLFQIAAQSSADPTVRAYMQLTVVVSVAFTIEMASDPPEHRAFPEGTVFFSIGVANVGNLPSAVKIDMRAQKPGPTDFAGWIATLDRDVVYLRGGESTTIQLQVYVASGAPAGTRLELVVSARSAAYAVEGRAATTTIVRKSCDFSLHVDGMGAVGPGGRESFDVNITNSGNANATASVSVARVPSGWLAATYVGGEAVSALDVPAFGSRNVTLEVVVPTNATAFFYSMDVRVTGEGCGTAQATLGVRVEATGDADVEVVPAVARAAPGQEAAFMIRIDGYRNDRMSVFLGLDFPEGIPVDFRPLLYLMDAEGTTITEPIVDGSVRLSALEDAVVSLVFTVPVEAEVKALEFTLWANSSTGRSVPVELRLEVLAPDLAISGVEHPPGEIFGGTSLRFLVTLENRGPRESGEGYLALLEGEQVHFRRTFGSLGPGEATVLDIPWTATAGHHNFSFVVVVTSGPRDADVENNRFAQPLAVRPLPPPLPLVEGLASEQLAAAFATASVAFLVGAFAVHRRARNKWWPPWPPRLE